MNRQFRSRYALQTSLHRAGPCLLSSNVRDQALDDSDDLGICWCEGPECSGVSAIRTTRRAWGLVRERDDRAMDSQPHSQFIFTYSPLASIISITQSRNRQITFDVHVPANSTYWVHWRNVCAQCHPNTPTHLPVQIQSSRETSNFVGD